MRKHIIGIYKIENINNGKVYIGQSVDILDRLSHHKRKLRNNAHINQHLQNAWNLYGESAFSFDILEQCEEHQLVEREHYYIELYGGYNSDKNYNKRDASNKGSLSEETKQKIGNANRGKSHSVEWNQKCSIAHIGKSTWNKGLTKEDLRVQKYVRHPGEFKHSEVSKQKMSASLKGRIYVHKGSEIRRIHPEQLSTYLNIGYTRGMGSRK